MRTEYSLVQQSFKRDALRLTCKVAILSYFSRLKAIASRYANVAHRLAAAVVVS
jgi:hypothetical protein